MQKKELTKLRKKRREGSKGMVADLSTTSLCLEATKEVQANKEKLMKKKATILFQ